MSSRLATAYFKSLDTFSYILYPSNAYCFIIAICFYYEITKFFTRWVYSCKWDNAYSCSSQKDFYKVKTLVKGSSANCKAITAFKISSYFYFSFEGYTYEILFKLWSCCLANSCLNLSFSSATFVSAIYLAFRVCIISLYISCFSKPL